MVEEEGDDRLDRSEPVGEEGHEGSDHRRAVDEQELTGAGVDADGPQREAEAEGVARD